MSDVLTKKIMSRIIPNTIPKDLRVFGINLTCTCSDVNIISQVNCANFIYDYFGTKCVFCCPDGRCDALTSTYDNVEFYIKNRRS